jgi:hypothetical protein
MRLIIPIAGVERKIQLAGIHPSRRFSAPAQILPDAAQSDRSLMLQEFDSSFIAIGSESRREFICRFHRTKCTGGQYSQAEFHCGFCSHDENFSDRFRPLK